ncbi:flagellar motor protein MotB [Paraburkholderia graminis]|uniref:OmpA family protein n=1 Tax=Paraburkholderia graminis TaxID=60548 RepID=UPI000DF01BF0|nr:OmpA family protein [Paraburkholderia graminis]AXF09438.1 flagellar motor protein MotB [Paraburkholderia graminis]MDR6469652.1 outer membrane protein OmpA-like peptidoglycan-associated protein [Paraburkholderia graminis]
MSINLIHAIQSALTDEVVAQLGERIGLPPQATRAVVTTAAPALLAGLMHKAATLEGARSLFATAVSPDVDARIAEQLPHLTDSTRGVSELEGAGRALLERSLDRRAESLSDEVAVQTGVPAHATHAITGIVGATMLGMLKQHLLKSQGSVGQLPALLSHQMPLIAPYLNDRLLGALGLGTLGLGTVGAFTGGVLGQLKAVSAHIEHPMPAAKPTPEVTAAVHVPADAVVGEKRRSHAWLWWLLLALGLGAALLAYLFPGSFAQLQHRAGDAVGESAQPVAAQPASAAVGASGELAAAVAASDGVASMVTGTVQDAAASAAVDAASAAASASASVVAASGAGVAGGASGVGGASGANGASGTSAANAANGAARANGASDAHQPGVAAAPSKNSQFAFSVNEAGKPTFTATVGSEAEKTQLIDELTKRLGQNNYSANITVDPATKPADWLTRLDGLVPLMSVPGAELKLDGTRIELSGAAANAKLGWQNALKSLFGASYDVGAFDPEHAVEQATANFRSAVKALLTGNPTCVAADIAKVLNLQVINFGSSSARVPATANEDLGQSARVLNACARNGRVAKLEVAGYSDNVGGEQANLQLSKERAEAVRSYLVKAGVPGDSLRAQGYGQAHPIAGNDTASGRFANRRIEFSAQQ